MKILSKICDCVFTILKYLVAALLIFMTLLTFVEVIRRYFFSQTFLWSEVLVRYMIVWCTFLGGAAAFRKGQLVSFDLVVQKLGAKNKLIMEIIVNILILAFVFWLTKMGTETFFKPSIVNQKSIELGGISIRWIYLGIPIGFLCMTLFTVEKVIGNIINLKKMNSDNKEGVITS